MADKEIKQESSFGRLFLSFLMLTSLIIFIISLQTSQKITESNEKIIENFLANKLDFIISRVFSHNYVRNSLIKIIEELKNNGVNSKEFTNLANETEYKFGVSVKGFFYKNLELKQTVNAIDKDLELFSNLLKWLCTEKTSVGFDEANRNSIKKLVEYYGANNRLELMQLRKGLFVDYSYKNEGKHFYWNTYDNKLGLFLYTTKEPNTINRLRHIKNQISDNNYGFISSNNTEIIPPEGFDIDQILQASLIISNSNKPFIIFNNHYCYFQTNRFNEKFCYVLPIKNNIKLYFDWIKLIEFLSAFLFFISVILYTTSVIKIFPGKIIVELLDNLSIRNRLIGLFTMASIFPVLITAIIGTAVLLDKQKLIEENIQSESLNVIFKMENQKDALLEKAEKMVNDLRNSIKEAYLANNPINCELFYKYLDKYSISKDLSRLDVRDAEIKTILTMDDRETNGLGDLLDLVTKVILKLHCPEKMNKQSLNISPAELLSGAVLATDELGFASIIRQRKKQMSFKVGVFPITWYWDIYPELKDGPAILFVALSMVTSFNKQIKDYIYSLPPNDKNTQLSVFVNNTYFYDKIISPYTNLPQEEIIDIGNVAFDTNKVVFRTIIINGKPYWITAKQEKFINYHIFMNLVSKKDRLSILEPFKIQIISIGIFALLISLYGAWFITNLIIVPIGDLSKGIMAIRQRNKDFSIPIRRKDEFGELAIAFNKVIGEFEELEYGKIIQEKLLPKSAPQIDGYDIAYFTISATDLAGDYHDNVILNDGRLSIILGDVSGHGISASLAMAMAKAVFNYAKAEKVQFPEEFMDMANTMFNKELKPRNKLMTLISMVLTPETGEIIFDNAGQSYPAYYSIKTKTTEEIKMPSLPLGGMKKRKKKTITKTMEHGDAILLYTDGIIEASAPNGEMFGYERFFEKFNEQMRMNISAKEAINHIYQNVEDFREKGYRQDDITMIIIKRL